MQQAVSLLCISAAGTIAAIVVWVLMGWLQAFFVLLLDVVVLTGLLVHLVGECEPVDAVKEGRPGALPPRPKLRTSP